MKYLATALIGLFLLYTTNPANAQISVDLPSIQADVGEEFTIDVIVGDLTGQNVLAYQFDVAYDTTVIELTGVEPSGTLTEGKLAFGNWRSDDEVFRVAASSGTPFSGSGILIKIEGSVLAEGASALTFSSFQFNDGVPAAQTSNGGVSTSNQAPTGSSISVETDEDEAITITLEGSDPEGAELQFSILSQPARGTLGSIQSESENTATVPYTPDADFSGTDTFDFRVSDGDLTGTGTVTVSVNPVQDAPTANDDSYLLDEGTVLEVDAASGVLANDDDPDEDELTASLVEDVSNGTLTLSTDGSFTYTPDEGFIGADFFTYTAGDGTEESEPATVTLAVRAAATHRALLSGWNVIPPVAGAAAGEVSAALDGDSISFSGAFEVSSSIQSADVHVVSVGSTGPSVIELTVSGDGQIDPTSNRFALVDSLIEALGAGRLYVDVHTTAYSDGEIRGQLRDADNVAPESSAIISPVDGTTLYIGGAPGESPVEGSSTLLDVSWQTAGDPDGDPVAYIHELSLESDFSSVIAIQRLDTTRGIALTVGEAAAQFDLDLGASLELNHRIITTDGSATTVGPVSSVTLIRGTITAAEGEAGLPDTFSLSGCYPNPFNPTTTVQFDLPAAASVYVEVVDALGRRVLSLPEKDYAAGGGRSLQIDASSLVSGTYFYRVIARFGARVSIESGKMTLLK